MRVLHGLLALLAVLWIGPAHAQDEPPAVGESAVGEAGAAAATHAQMRDPFRPFTLNMRPEAPVQVTPLQRFEIGQLTLVATVWEMSPPRALVEDSFGMGYIITLGTPIGPNDGVVRAIEPQRVLVEERVLDFYGKERINQVVMETPREEPNQPGRERK
jgi:Tfp pilus assembly protein PilP